MALARLGKRRGVGVPVISVFFGIVIRMFYREHGVAHFHAEHQGQQATFTFVGKLLAGSIASRTALRLITEWAKGRKLYGHLYDDLLKLKYLHQRYTNYLRWLKTR